MDNILLDLAFVCIGILTYFVFDLQKRIKRIEDDLQRDK